MQMPRLMPALGILAVGIAVACPHVNTSGFFAAARAEESDAIIRALKPRKTRSIAKSDPAAAGRVNELKQINKTRGLNHQERQELNQITRDNPQIDLTIYFALDSAEISEQAVPQLNELGKALAGGLKGQAFTLGGHTDGRGSPDYNLALSKRRAEAVQRYLVERFGLNAEDLLPVGFGFELLKNAQNPLADENRRVQIINLTR